MEEENENEYLDLPYHSREVPYKLRYKTVLTKRLRAFDAKSAVGEAAFARSGPLPEGPDTWQGSPKVPAISAGTPLVPLCPSRGLSADVAAALDHLKSMPSMSRLLLASPHLKDAHSKPFGPLQEKASMCGT